VLGLKMIIPFPLKFFRGLCFWVFMPVLFWEFVHFVGIFLWVVVCEGLRIRVFVRVFFFGFAIGIPMYAPRRFALFLCT
jgi:hypothetical protein